MEEVKKITAIENDEQKKRYELSYLTRSEVGVSEILHLLKSGNADVLFEGPCNKINLAYKIEKEHDAFFGYFHFSLSPNSIKPIEKSLRASKEIIRFLLITPPFVKSEKKSAMRPEVKTSFVIQQKQQPSPDRLPISNEELEKKIGEILQ